MVNLVSVLLSDKLLQFRCCNMSLTLEVLCCLPVTYLTALLCTDSIWWIPSVKYGAQTEQANSKDGRTNDLYVCSFTEVEVMFKFLRKKPNVIFALFVMLFIWLCHLRSDWIVTPKYLALFTCSKIWPWRVWLYFIGFMFTKTNDITLSGEKAMFHLFSHIPSLSRSC